MATYDFASHLLALLESSAAGAAGAHEALSTELFRLSNVLTKLELQIGEKAVDLGQKPAHLWTEDEILFAQCDSRVDFLQELLDDFDEEAKLIDGLPSPMQFDPKRHLLSLLISCLECEEDLPCESRLGTVDAIPKSGHGVLGPRKLPPWVQALCLLESELLAQYERTDVTTTMRELVQVQRYAIQELRMFLICDLFPTQEGVYYSQGFTIHVDSGWQIVVVAQATAPSDDQ